MSDWLQLSLGSTSWTVDPAWRDKLLDASGLRISEWERTGTLERLKEAAHRSIYRVQLGGSSFFIKHYPVHDARSFLRQLLRLPKAVSELRCIQALREHGVPTVRPLACGVGPRGESFLVTRGLENVEPLDRFVEFRLPALARPEQNAWRRRLIPELARLIALLHDRGVVHGDLYAGNILVELRPGTSPPLYLIDLHGLRLGQPLSWQASRKNLIMFARWFMERASRADRRRFWQQYCRFRKDWNLSREQERERGREMESRTWKSLLRFYVGREKRCLGRGRRFYRAAALGCRAWASQHLPPADLHRVMVDPEALFRQPDCRVLKSGPSSRVAEVELRIDGEPRRVICKQFHSKRWGIALGRLFRSTPAYRSWLNAFRFEDRGLPTPRGLALIHRMRFGLIRDSFLLMEKVAGAAELPAYLQWLDALPSAQRVNERRALVEQVARLLRRLHRHRFYHQDLKGANILVQSSANLGQTSLVFIDLVGVVRGRRVSRRRRARDLARLHVSFHDDPRLSRTDKLRFLRIYLQWALRGKNGWKSWWRQIAQTTQAKVARNRRLGRPIT